MKEVNIMAKKKNVDLSFLNPALNKKLATSVQDNIDSAYKQTYFSNAKDAKYIEALRRMADKDLNALMDRTRMRNNGHSISDLYARTLAFSSDDDTIMEFKQALQDESMLTDLMDMYSQNAVQRDIDREIDVVCKYVPKLEEALDIKADHVLSADHFNKDSITITPITNETGKNDTENLDTQYGAKSDIEAFKKKYRLKELMDELYKKTAKYGEQFVYIVSYNKALKRLVKRNNNTQLLAESSVITEQEFDEAVSSINESFIVSYGKDEINPLSESVIFNDIHNRIIRSDGYDNIEVEINETGVIPGIIYEAQNTRRILKETALLFDDNDVTSLNEARKLGANSDTLLSNNSYLKNMRSEFKKFSKEGGTLKSPTKLDMDGFTDKKKSNKKEENINIPGCVVRLLDHTMVKVLRIDETVLGYYFIECNRDMENNQTTFSSTLGGLKPRRSARDRENMERPPMDDQVLMKVARQISKRIDSKFINSNQDLAKEIYTILKYNADHGDGKVSKIRVSFLPPNDVVHVYFDINKKTWRGKSDLQKSLFPAKLLSCLYISNTIALLTRGYDKRIYQVRQTVDTNIQAVLLSVINQIKQSNFNLRQIENMNNILNVTGRFNDIVIPQNVNGESPVNFEVLPGQNIEIKSEFMAMLEEMAINLTGVSLEMVNTRLQEQTATHITMTNSRFLIKIHDRQIRYQDYLSEIFTKIYQNEYGIEDELEVTLPPPAMLNFTNTSQLVGVANELIQNIVLMKTGGNNAQNEVLKAELTSGLMEYYFKTFLPMEEINKIYDEAQINIANTAERAGMRQQFAQQAMAGGSGGGMPQGGGYQ